MPRIFDIVENNDYLYIIVDYIKGISLDRKLKEEGRFPEVEVLDWAMQICGVLKYLHSFKPNPIIYRDMKPSNIILGCDGNIKLIDFGIAREYKESCGSDTVYIGTRGYAAPEQYGTGQTSITSDIYSLGVTLHHLVTGKNPNEFPYELKPVRSFDETLSKGIEDIIGRCTRQNPEKRYQSVHELGLDLQRIARSKDAGMESIKDSCGIQECELTPNDFNRMVITVWDNAEFGCEMAYVIARKTGLRVMLIDIDLLSPKADLFLNLKKFPDRIMVEGLLNRSGLNIVMDSGTSL